MKKPKVHTVWEAYKAVFRGNLMTLNGKEKRKKEEKLKNLQDKIKKTLKETVRIQL